MKIVLVIFFLVAVLFVFNSKCGRMTHSKRVTTELRLNSLRKIISGEEELRTAVEQTQLLSSPFELRRLIDNDASSTIGRWLQGVDVLDGWGLPILAELKLHNNQPIIYIWSAGPDKVSQNGDGDDIVVFVELRKK
jgi:hypothetical protein